MRSFSLRRITSEYNLQLFLCSGLLTLSSLNFGFDQTGYSTIQAMDAFARQFGGKCTAKGGCKLDPQHLSFLNGFPFLTFAVGSLIGSMMSERFGRRPTVIAMSVWAVVCATITITSKTYSQILAARCLNYVYAGMELSVIPVYQSEMLPAPIRGFGVASYQMSLSVGVLLMSICTRFTSEIKGNLSWRIPVALFYVAPTIVSVLTWFIPESPRWLLAQHREEDARKALNRLRVRNDQESIDNEISLILLGLAAHEDQQQSSYIQLFRGTSRRRTLISMACCFFLQASGQALNSQYGAVFVKSLGTVNPFDYKLIVSCLQITATLSTMFLTDVLGRRPMMITGITMQGITMILVGGLGSITDPARIHGALTGAVASLILFAFSYSMGWGALNWVVVAEISDQKLRDKNQRVATWVNFAVNGTVTFVIPFLTDAPANLGPKVGFIFGAICICGTLFAFFFLPELANRTTEEINLLFDSGITARQSAKWRPDNLRETLEISVQGKKAGGEDDADGDDVAKGPESRREMV